MTAEMLTLVPHETTTKTPEAAPLKRCAIIGTAPSWKACPYDDPTLEIWSLNDAYLIGVPHAHRWYDLHPTHQMYFRSPTGQALDPTTVPIGSYVRPHGHLDWLRSRPFPVFLAAAHPSFPQARAFPQAAVLEHFARFWPLRRQRNGSITAGPDYEVSTPSWMLMHAIMEGYREVHVYGIHLATEWEYLQQRPNFEFLLGVAAGLGVKIVLPQATPLCKAGYRYAFEPKADLPVQKAQQAIHLIKAKGLALRQAYEKLRFFEVREKRAIEAQLRALDVELADAKQVHTWASQRAETGVVR